MQREEQGGRRRILVHDYSGHPFQVQLSRELARRGDEVLHLYFKGFQTPRGALVRQPDDPPGFAVEGLDLGEPFQKYSFVKRRQQEIAYGRRTIERLEAFAPDIVVCSNLPLDPLDMVGRHCRQNGIRFVVWLQDIYSIAMGKILPRKLPVLGHAVSRWFTHVERRTLKAADNVVCITEDFLPILERWGVARQRCAVIENWAPKGEIVPLPPTTAWAAEQGLAGTTILLYSGTLGLKHDPAGIAALARACRDRPEVRVVVVSEGVGADWLRDARQEAGGGLDNLVLLPFQPYARLSEVLASAAVVLAVIEPEAGIFSVPSKVLSYLSAGRPILLAVPPENLAARTVLGAEAGLVVAPGDTAGLIDAARRLLDDPALRDRLGRNGRAYAERTFDIAAITDRFEALWGGTAERIVQGGRRAA
jgi:colanic acid biosynthesis glycosyl transferase WcaI